jgi:hypothetical protein
MTSASASDILRLRLASQLLTPGALPVAEVIRHLLAMQAQDFGQALWAIGTRAECSRDEVLAALASGEVVRSAPFRGTLMFVASDDLGWMLDLTAERTIASAATRLRVLELDARTLERAKDVAIGALDGGRNLQREGFFAELERAGISTTGQRGYNLIWWLAQKQVICWGPPAGTQQALVLFDEWLPDARRLELDEALAELARRYFSGHGPATLKDFAWWAKITLTDARAGIASSELETIELDGSTYYVAGTDYTAGTELAPAKMVLALPGFDEYLLGYSERSLLLSDDYFRRIVPGGNGMFMPMIVVDGRIVGTWKRMTRAAGTTVAEEFFEPVPARAAKAFGRAAEGYVRFVG